LIVIAAQGTRAKLPRRCKTDAVNDVDVDEEALEVPRKKKAQKENDA